MLPPRSRCRPYLLQLRSLKLPLLSWRRVQRLLFSAQVPELRARLQADARRTFRNEPSQMVCHTFVSAATRVRLDVARRSAPDTVAHDARFLCVLNGQILTSPAAAAAVVAVPPQATKAIKFLMDLNNIVIYWDRSAAGVVQVTV